MNRSQRAIAFLFAIVFNASFLIAADPPPTLTLPFVFSDSMVHFGWSETAMPNLVNGAGLPASPFGSE